MEEANKTLVLCAVEGFLNSGEPALADELFSPDYRDNNPSNPEMDGLENIKRSVADWHRAFPDTANEVEGIIAEDDLVAARWVTRGTHRGEFLGIPASGYPIEVTSSGLFRIEDGRISESWDHFDALGFLRQLGATLRPEGEAP